MVTSSITTPHGSPRGLLPDSLPPLVRSGTSVYGVPACFKCKKMMQDGDGKLDDWGLCPDCAEEASEASMDSTTETWPANPRYYASQCEVHSELPSHSRLREFTIGARCFHSADHLDSGAVAHECPQLDPEKCAMDFQGFISAHTGSLGPDPRRLTFHTKVLIITEAITEIRVSARMGVVNGVTLCKDAQVLQAGCVVPALEQRLPLDTEKPFFRKIQLQQAIWENASKNVLEKGIVYLRMETMQGNALQIGEPRSPGTSGATINLPMEVAEGTLAIVALGLAHATPISFQLVDFCAVEDPMEHLNTVFYSRDLLSFLCITDNLPLYEHLGMIAIENADFLPVVDELLDGVENANPSSSELLPSTISTIDEALASSNATIHSVFRLDRYLMYVVATRSEVKMWGDSWNHYKKLLPLKQMFSVFSDMILLTKRIAVNKPEPNMYCYAFLSGQWSDYIKAYLTFATQLLLITMLFMGIDLSQFGDFPQAVVFSITVTAIVVTIVKGQVENHLAFRSTFLDANLKDHIILMDFLGNVVLAAFVVLSNFLLLASTVEYLDLVLNATAIIFIIELDDAALNADDDAVTDLCRGMCYKMVRRGLALKDDRYWNAQQLREDRPRIHLEHAALVWPESLPQPDKDDKKKKRHRRRKDLSPYAHGAVTPTGDGGVTPAQRPSMAPGMPSDPTSRAFPSPLVPDLRLPSGGLVEDRRMSRISTFTTDSRLTRLTLTSHPPDRYLGTTSPRRLLNPGLRVVNPGPVLPPLRPGERRLLSLPEGPEAQQRR